MVLGKFVKVLKHFWGILAIFAVETRDSRPRWKLWAAVTGGPKVPYSQVWRSKLMKYPAQRLRRCQVTGLMSSFFHSLVEYVLVASDIRGLRQSRGQVLMW